MTRTKYYIVQYFKKLGKERNQWHNIPKARFESKEAAEEYAERCKRGFGETRVQTICAISTK